MGKKNSNATGVRRLGLTLLGNLHVSSTAVIQLGSALRLIIPKLKQISTGFYSLNLASHFLGLQEYSLQRMTSQKTKNLRRRGSNLRRLEIIEGVALA